MKITNAEVIRDGEKDLIDSITADLDWGAIENIFLSEHNLGIDEDIEYKSGDIISYDNQVAYKLEFTVKVNLSILINREGEYLSVKISGKGDNKGPENNHGDSHGTLAEDTSQDPGKQDSLEDNVENEIKNDGEEAKEDKYMKALEQVGSDDSKEDTEDQIS